MTVKKAKQKKNQRKWLTENAVKIKCCYCDARDTCKSRVRKEKWEQDGCMTACVMTPNSRRKKKKNKVLAKA